MSIINPIPCPAEAMNARVSIGLACVRLPMVGISLSFHRHQTFYTIRTAPRYRFEIPMKKRFTRSEIESMVRDAGLVDIRFSEDAPYWCAVGIRK